MGQAPQESAVRQAGRRRPSHHAAVLAFGLAISWSAGGHAETIFATEGTYPPWNEARADGRLEGFDVDLVKALCRAIDAECKLKTATFPRMMNQLADREFDAIISGIAITPERLALIQFTRPYMSLSVSFAVRGNSPLGRDAQVTIARTLQLLSHARVGAQRATVNSELVRSLLPDATLILFDNQESLSDDVVAGRVEAGLAATQAWKHHGDAADRTIVTLGPPLTSTDYPVLGEGLAIGIAKENDALKASLDKATCGLTADGTIGKLSVEWFGDDLSVPCN